ncbi:hypothetical protein [Noviherbaspirillum pedocola]|uniref:Uncharacterized protein n=1 Tax=Noviherbaspirillum pedocola TaxID=2801341 RepID=A0A934W5D9_9BURK|nr:hypothetical protein [Noviherbaspirillum pedocola]MBK4733108.1 hypothetical protein [Noviherbaspirillum pedocola]
MAVGKGSGRAGGAGKTPSIDVSRAKQTSNGEGRQGSVTTPGRPRVRAAEKERRDASPNARKEKVTDTPTRQLRRQAAESGMLSLDSPVRLSPRTESPRPESPRVEDSRRGKKRRAGEGVDEGEAAHAGRQRKRARITSAAPEPVDAEAKPASAPVPTPQKGKSSRKETNIFRTMTGSGLRGFLQKDKKTPSSEELRRDPDDEGDDGRESRLPQGLSFMFSRGAIPTTVLDSTTEEAPPRRQDARAPESETETGEG